MQRAASSQSKSQPNTPASTHTTSPSIHDSPRQNQVSETYTPSRSQHDRNHGSAHSHKRRRIDFDVDTDGSPANKHSKASSEHVYAENEKVRQVMQEESRKREEALEKLGRERGDTKWSYGVQSVDGTTPVRAAQENDQRKGQSIDMRMRIVSASSAEIDSLLSSTPSGKERKIYDGEDNINQENDNMDREAAEILQHDEKRAVGRMTFGSSLPLPRTNINRPTNNDENVGGEDDDSSSNDSESESESEQDNESNKIQDIDALISNTRQQALDKQRRDEEKRARKASRVKDRGENNSTSKNDTTTLSSRRTSVRKCFTCGVEGHRAIECLEKNTRSRKNNTGQKMKKRKSVH